MQWSGVLMLTLCLFTAGSSGCLSTGETTIDISDTDSGSIMQEYSASLSEQYSLTTGETITTFPVDGVRVRGIIAPIGNVTMVAAITDHGLVGCGAFDVIALETFSYPAVKVKATTSDSIRTIEDLLAGEVTVANSFAQEYGVSAGMSGEEAIRKLLP